MMASSSPAGSMLLIHLSTSSWVKCSVGSGAGSAVGGVVEGGSVEVEGLFGGGGGGGGGGGCLGVVAGLGECGAAGWRVGALGGAGGLCL